MLGITPVVQNKQIILWDLPQGILNPENENDTSRTHCPRSKGRTCWMDVFQYILHGAERVMNDEIKKVDKAIVSLRNQLNQNRVATKVAPVGNGMLSTEKFNLNTQGAKQNAENLIKFFKTDKNFEIELELMEGFQKQKETLFFKKYLSDLIAKEGTATYETFFNELNVNPLNLIPTPIHQLMYEVEYMSMQEYPIDIQYSRIANSAAKILIAQSYKLPASTWNPAKGIDLLFNEVKKHGVIGFGGLFGKNLYSAPPHVVLKVSDREIYGWNATERKNDTTTGHFIAVVGVKKETNKKMISEGKVGYVIYNDPVDGTDPQNPTQRKFYIVSYPTFIKYVTSEFNTNINPESIEDFEKSFLSEYPNLKPFTYGLLPNPPYTEATSIIGF